jgi:hypothetical protein
LPKEGQAGWLLGANEGALPLPHAQWPLLFDVANPCAGLGLSADCRSLGSGVQAGRDAKRWQYRLSGNRGPGMTSRGEMWLDAETGLVLAYRGETGVGQPLEWQVRSVEYAALPDELFALPEERLQMPSRAIGH